MFVERVRTDERRVIICDLAPEALPPLLEEKRIRTVPYVVAELAEAAPVFRANFRRMQDANDHYKRLIKKKGEVLHRLKMYVRHARRVLDKRVLRGDASDGSLLFYEWTPQGGWPKTVSQMQWIMAAKHLVEGDPHAVGNGYSPLVEPRADEIKVLYEQAWDLSVEVDRQKDKLRALERKQEPVRKDLDVILRRLKSMIISETCNKTQVWRIMLKAAGFVIRYHKQPPEESIVITETNATADPGQPIPRIASDSPPSGISEHQETMLRSERQEPASESPSIPSMSLRSKASIKVSTGKTKQRLRKRKKGKEP